jgi:cardiolipin synthase
LTRKKCLAINPPANTLRDEECLVRIRRNDWVYSKTEITKTYREIFHDANSQVTIMTSYFWPPQKLLTRMAAAAGRNVKVRLILTAKADVPFSKYTERYLYSWLFRNKIEVYEYQANILHGKLAVCDNKWLTAGSYNVNNISAYASVELNLDIKNTAVATEVDDELQDIIKNNCVQITKANFSINSHPVKKLFYYLSYRIVHWIFFLFTFYFIQKREKD